MSMSTVSDRPRQGEVIEPCPVHGVRCKSRRSEPNFTRYYCPVETCDYSIKRPRHENKLVELYLADGTGAVVGERLNRGALEQLTERQARCLMNSLQHIAGLIRDRIA